MLGEGGSPAAPLFLSMPGLSLNLNAHPSSHGLGRRSGMEGLVGGCNVDGKILFRGRCAHPNALYAGTQEPGSSGSGF